MKLNKFLWNALLIILILILLYSVFIYFFPSKSLSSNQGIVSEHIKSFEQMKLECMEKFCENFYDSYLDGEECYCYNSQFQMVKRGVMR